MTVADRIKYRRESLGISQEELAKRIGLKDKSSITKIEKAGDKISLKHIEKISQALDVSVQFLMGWDKEEKINENNTLEKAAADIRNAVNKSMTEEEKHLQLFTGHYKKLNPEQKSLVDNMIEALLKKQ